MYIRYTTTKATHVIGFSGGLTWWFYRRQWIVQ